MNNVNKTLYIPLYGKAYVSRRNLFLQDPTAETIWEKEGFALKGKAKSKWLAYNMGMRSAVFDRWTAKKMSESPDAVVLHLGCGMDSRVHRLGAGTKLWFDVDFPDVIGERQRYFAQTPAYHMLGCDLREDGWLDVLPSAGTAIVVMEGVSMYLTNEELQQLLSRLCRRFEKLHILMDSYTVFAAKATKYKNPINEVGVTQVYGFDDPELLTGTTGLTFVREHDLTPEELIARLPKGEQGFFRLCFAGRAAKKIYRLYEYKKDTVRAVSHRDLHGF